MGGVISGVYLIINAILVLVCRTLPPYRSILLAIAGLTWWSTLGDLSSLTPGLGLLVLGYVGIYVVRACPTLLGAVVCLVLSWFAWLRLYPPFSLIPHPISMIDVGSMFLLFRLLHLLVESAAGVSYPGVRPQHILGYLLALPAFSSGPIQRFDDFHQQIQRPTPPGGWAPALLRVGDGYLKLVVVSALFLEWSQTTPASPLGYATSLGAYTLYLYANFSGVTDIAIGFGRMVGLNFPENFDRPLEATNFLDFWNRWHISASQWCRDYIFNPLLKSLVSYTPTAAYHPWLGVLSLLITFFLMGLWHGPGPAFVLYGILLGIGAAIVKTWQLLLRRHLGKTLTRSLNQSGFYAAGCRGLTFTWMSLCLACFWMDKTIFQDLGEVSKARDWAMGLVMLWAASSVILELWSKLDPLRASVHARMESLQAHVVGLQIGLACRAAIVILFMMLQVRPLPPQVY